MCVSVCVCECVCVCVFVCECGGERCAVEGVHEGIAVQVPVHKWSKWN